MAILTNNDIQRIVNKRDLIIHPLVDESITGLGYDLHIGCIQPLSHILGFSNIGGQIKIPAGCYCVVITKEFVWLSGKLAGTLHSRGTLAAKGLYTNATNVDPNFKGQMIMSIVNLSNVDILLKEGQTFITLILHEVLSPTSTLVGEEGTKNSMRVTNEMITSIYTNKANQEREIESVNHLVHFLNTSNQEFSSTFDRKIHEAMRYNLWRTIKEMGRSSLVAYDKSAKAKIMNCLILTCYLFVVFTAFKLIKIMTETGGTADDWRALCLAFIAVLTLLTLLKSLLKKN